MNQFYYCEHCDTLVHHSFFQASIDCCIDCSIYCNGCEKLVNPDNYESDLDCCEKCIKRCVCCNRDVSLEDYNDDIDCCHDCAIHCEYCCEDIHPNDYNADLNCCTDCVQQCSECGKECNPEQYNSDSECCEDCSCYCESCNTHVSLSNYSGNGYCDSCGSYCESCGEVVSNEDFNFDTCQCNECSPESNNQIHSYSYRPRPVFFENLTTKNNGLFLGLELETGLNDRDCGELPDKEELYYKEDSSIGATIDCEIVSHPCTLEYHKEELNWEGICKEFKDLGFESWNLKTCGIHIHASKDFLDENEQQTLSVFFYSNIAKVHKIARRSNSSYATVPKDKAKKALDGDWKSHGRYEALNWENSKTIEFRVFRGTLVHQKVLAFLEFVDGCMSFVKTIKSNEIVESKDSCWNDFCKFLESDKERYSNILEHGKHVKAIERD